MWAYLSRSAWAEAERRRGLMGEARNSRGANADAVVGGERGQRGLNVSARAAGCSQTAKRGLCESLAYLIAVHSLGG